MGKQQWVVSVKNPQGRHERTRVTSIVIDQEPTLEDIRGAVGECARLLVDSLWVQEETGRWQDAMNELAGHEEDAQ
jgi:hypothetical protein